MSNSLTSFTYLGEQVRRCVGFFVEAALYTTVCAERYVDRLASVMLM